MSTLNIGNSFDQSVPSDGSGDTPETGETTQWAQKQFLDSNECFGQECTAEEASAPEVPYLARGGQASIKTEWAKPTFTLDYSECFCAHSNGFGDLDHLEGIDLAPHRLEMDAIVDEWGEAARHAMLGFFNHVGYWWGHNIGALQKTKRGRFRVDKAIARGMASATTLMQCAVTGVVDYLGEHWGIGLTRQTFSRWMDKCLQGLGIVEWAGVAGQGKKPRHWSINMPAMLLLAEACERRILADARMAGASHGEEMAVLPEHKGATLKLLFDAVFPGFGWNRLGGPEDAEPRTYAETDAYRPERAEPEPMPATAQTKRDVPLMVKVGHIQKLISQYGGVEDWILEKVDKLREQCGDVVDSLIWGVAS